jgi:beta-mannosidase
MTLHATDLFGSFFDTNLAFRFGAPSHNITVGRLVDTDTGEVIAEAFHFPQGRASALEDSQIDVGLTRLSDETWTANLSCDRFAQTVTVTCDGFRPDDNYFHLAPGLTRSIQLTATSATSAGILPSGSVSSLGGRSTIRF